MLENSERWKRRLKRFIRQMHRRVSPPGPINLIGDRDIEWSYVAARIPPGTKRVLDFGNGGSPLALTAALKGHDVTALDINDVHWPYKHPLLSFVKGDIRGFRPNSTFDIVINCSTIEHVGLRGRYGVSEPSPDGDLDAMNQIRQIMAPGGTMLLTLPVGQDALFSPMCRIYGHGRLPQLLQGFVIREEVYWTKDPANRWNQVGKMQALQFEAFAGSDDPLRSRYGLGCYTLEVLGES